MPSNPPRRPAPGPSGTGRVFADDGGRLWNASITMVKGVETLVFTCVSEARQPTRALSAVSPFDLASASEADLQRLLSEAPRVRLIE